MYKPQVELSIETITRNTAQRYKLRNIGLAEACDHNAAVARSLGRHEVALTWTVLKTVHASGVRSEATRPVSGDLNTAGEAMGALEAGGDWRQRLRTSSFGTRKVSKAVTMEAENGNNATRSDSIFIQLTSCTSL